ncbi:MAG: hypothetical protein OQJ76_06005 [Rhodospirillales bacterium]|nr:hypothetical protein [Rhodospirillales bacterium]
MSEKVAELKELLRAAEKQIESLRGELGNYAQMVDDLMVAQRHETEQMVQMTEQIWALEEALASTSQEREKALALAASLKGGIDSIRNRMTQTLEAAEKDASRLEIAARVYEMAAASEIEDVDKMFAEFNAQLQSKVRS